MAVTPIGNLTFINQNAQVSSVQQANTQVKLDFQSMVNLQTLQEQQEEIQEVRPTEETLAVNDEREGNGKREKDEEEKQESKEQEHLKPQKLETDTDNTIPHLDISV